LDVVLVPSTILMFVLSSFSEELPIRLFLLNTLYIRECFVASWGQTFSHQMLLVSFLQDLLLNKLLGEDFLTEEER
jgi:hypothetical protein